MYILNLHRPLNPISILSTITLAPSDFTPVGSFLSSRQSKRTHVKITKNLRAEVIILKTSRPTQFVVKIASKYLLLDLTEENQETHQIRFHYYF